MTNLNISMPEAMKEFIEADVRRGSYSTPSEFVRELVREFQRRKATQSEERLMDALATGKPITDDEALEAICRKLRERIDRRLLATLESGAALAGDEDPSALRGDRSAHAATALARSADFASSSTATACSRETLGKSSRKASRKSPPSIQSISVCTGTRVPANTGAPLRRSSDVVIRGSGTLMVGSYTLFI